LRPRAFVRGTDERIKHAAVDFHRLIDHCDLAILIGLMRHFRQAAAEDDGRCAGTPVTLAAIRNTSRSQ
jgi:hypothetical protein